MTYSRYGLRRTKSNSNSLYRNLSEKRGNPLITHYCAPKFAVLTDDIIDTIDVEFVYWSTSSRFSKLAEEHYGDPTLWWVIAHFNKKPTDFHAKIGDLIYIPIQWEVVYNSIIESYERYT